MKTILLVEDDKVLGEAFVIALKSAGYNVLHALNGQDAIDILDNSKADLIVLDMFLPGGNGLQFLHELKSYGDTANIPVIVCSANTGSLNKKTLAAYGVLTVLSKATLTPAVLRQAVADVV
jgi:two-component system chemotaxis response regulator CheY